MKRNFIQKFELMTDNLKTNKNITINELHFNEPAADEEIEVARNFVNGKLPTGVEDFYREMNGFNLQWEHTIESIKENSDADRGFINLLPIQEVFGDWKDIVWFDDFEGGDRYQPVKPFDFFTNEACAAFYCPSNHAIEDFVYFHYLGEELHKTNYSFLEYIEKLIASRGYFYWIETLSDDLQERPEATSFRAKMPMIFEDYNDELFHPKKLKES